MEAELKRQLDSYLDMYEEKKAEFKQAEKEYFGFACTDYEKCEALRKHYKETERAHEVVASVLADFVLENREKIKVQ